MHFDEPDLTDKLALTDSVLNIPRSRSRVSRAVYAGSLCGRRSKGKSREFGRETALEGKGRRGGDFLPSPSRAFCAFCAPGIPLPFKRLLRRLVTQLGGVFGANMSIRTSLEK